MGNSDNKRIYAVYDITGIQSYVFGSNKLKENAGASKLVGNVLNGANSPDSPDGYLQHSLKKASKKAL